MGQSWLLLSWDVATSGLPLTHSRSRRSNDRGSHRHPHSPRQPSNCPSTPSISELTAFCLKQALAIKTSLSATSTKKLNFQKFLLRRNVNDVTAGPQPKKPSLLYQLLSGQVVLNPVPPQSVCHPSSILVQASLTTDHMHPSIPASFLLFILFLSHLLWPLKLFLSRYHLQILHLSYPVHISSNWTIAAIQPGSILGHTRP